MKLISASRGDRGEHLRRSVVRVEILCGPERDRARRVYDVADRCHNPATAQDRLIRCPSISRLMRADWEKGDFDPRRGMTAGPHGRRFLMAEVTCALACPAAGPQPVAAHLAATPAGCETLWEDLTPPSPGLRSTPPGRVRVVPGVWLRDV
ncbi:hypothetical protein [Streptomyces sp. NPDC005890]|uniref:hypothetical protein n=1 Tax=Streptomyces sp. NPDC005890 TaxID=3154568 RepID=UPI0033F72667